MLSEEDFWQKWRKFFKKYTYPPKYRKFGLHYPDDYEMDTMLLVTMDDMSPDVIKTILANNMEHYEVPRSQLWLADDDYESLPDFNGLTYVEGTTPAEVDNTWRSSFAGKSLADVATWIRNIPKPPKAVCKTFFAAVQQDLYGTRGMVLICKVMGEGEEPQTIPYDASHVAAWHAAYDRHKWQMDWERQVEG